MSEIHDIFTRAHTVIPEKQRSERSRVPKHGATLAAIYVNAVLKRARKQKKRKR